MIKNKEDLKNYINQDAKACRRNTIQPSFFGDYVWKFQIYLRKSEYYNNCVKGIKKILLFPIILFNKYKYKKIGMTCGFSIPLNVFGPGLSIAHPGTIIVNKNSKIGKNCRIQTGVCLGATNGSEVAPILGDNIFISEGAKIIGAIKIANDVAIGANAVVVKDIEEEGTTWGGIPAKKISNNNSHSNLAPNLFEK